MAKLWKEFWKSRILLCAAAVILFAGALGTEAFAADPYTYTVTIYAGKQGKMVSEADLSVSGGSGGHSVSVSEDRIVVSGLAYGSRVSFSARDGRSVNLTAENGSTVSEGDPGNRYYIMGIRESGRDNKGAGNESFVVTEDTDYVVAYGIRGNNMVAYTVRYEDAAGNELASPRTYYGNVGDRPVVGWIYIDNYRPQAYNLTKELVENEAENVFTFVYTPMETGGGGGGAGTNETVTVVVPGETAGIQPGGTTILPGGAGGGQAAAGGAQEAGAEAGAGGQAAEEPAELINLDDEEVPLANMEGDDEEVPLAGKDGSQSSFPIVAGVLIAVLAAAVLVIAVVLAKKRKEKDEDKKADKKEDSAESKR